jgi:hypothetical protein
MTEGSFLIDEPFRWKGEGWIRFNEAVMAALMELETGIGVLQRRLRQQCASGDVRSIRCQVIFEEGEVFQVIEDPQLINPREWTEDNLDFTADDPNDESKPISTVVAVSEADLWHWIAGVVETEGGPVVVASSAKAKVGKVPRIKAWLAREYPDGVPEPADCPRQELLSRLLKGDPALRSVDPKTLRTAIAEHNAGKR